jgi:N-acetylglutamate synthase-like GNAT family acetyltransferase
VALRSVRPFDAGRFNRARRIELLQKRANRRAIPTVIVATLEGELAGSATLAESDLETRRDLTPWMRDVFAPQLRRRGIASTLVRRIVEEAHGLGVAELYLFTTGKMREQLYVDLGWSVIDRPIYQDDEHVLMSIRPR